MKHILIALIISVSATANADTNSFSTDVKCWASGNSVSQKGAGMIPGKASFEFTVNHTLKANRILTNITGEFTVAEEGESLTSEYSYHNVFKINSLSENPDYNPRKYVGYSQYPKFDATETLSGEDGMWGNFVLQQDMSGSTFKAHYIFQAGDHMGGTLHLNCKKI